MSPILFFIIFLICTGVGRIFLQINSAAEAFIDILIAAWEKLNILEMKRVLELQPFIPNANRLNIWQLNNLSHRLKDNLSKY